MTMQDRYLPRVWTDEGYYYPVFSELGITYENSKFGGKYEEMKNLDWVYAWFFGENDLEFKYKLEMPTSLKDKNGKLIYEGDIIKQGNSIYKVIFSYDDVASCGCCIDKFSGCGFVMEDKYGCRGDLDIYSELEIIGNIHENGDLLNED